MFWVDDLSCLVIAVQFLDIFFFQGRVDLLRGEVVEGEAGSFSAFGDFDAQFGFGCSLDDGLIEDGFGGSYIDGFGVYVETDIIGDAFGLDSAFCVDAEGFAGHDFDLAR